MITDTFNELIDATHPALRRGMEFYIHPVQYHELQSYYLIKDIGYYAGYPIVVSLFIPVGSVYFSAPMAI
jgi:hypothetical protein